MAGVVRGHREAARALASSFELIVCDDGSTDGTWAELQRSCMEVAELRLLRNPSRQGIPPTMKRLYAEAQGEWIYFTPADGQVPAAALEPMWGIRDGAALVVGRRVPRRDPASRVVIAQLYSGLLRRIFRLPVHDIDSVKLYRRRISARSAAKRVELLRGRDPHHALLARPRGPRDRHPAPAAHRGCGRGRHPGRGIPRDA